LRPFIENYTTLSAIYAVVRNAYTKKVYADRAFQKKTNELVQQHIGVDKVGQITAFLAINEETVRLINEQQGGDGTKVINLVKSIEKAAEESSGDPFLVAMAARAQAVLESFEERQTSTGQALAELLSEIDRNEERKRQQAAKGLDGLTYFVLCKLQEEGVANAEAVSSKVREAFAEFPNWRRSERELRELRKKVTIAMHQKRTILIRYPP
jgi:type I restriction enzyme, R subunit